MKLSFDFCLLNASNKIWVFWRFGFHFHVLCNSEQFLHVMVGHDSWTDTVNASFVYAKCTRAERRILWSELSSLAGSISRPWLVGGISTLSAPWQSMRAGRPRTLGRFLILMVQFQPAISRSSPSLEALTHGQVLEPVLGSGSGWIGCLSISTG